MFKDVLRSLRIKNDMSQAELAGRLNLAKSTISMYESGAREPSLEILEGIADIFNVDMNTLTDSEKYASRTLKENFHLTNHEKQLIIAYRQQSPTAQSMIDKLLDINPQQETKTAKEA